MPNYKLSIDLSDHFHELLILFSMREFTVPFFLYFIDAENPDDACFILYRRVINSILKEDDSIKTRILCRKIRRDMRVDKIYSL